MKRLLAAALAAGLLSLCGCAYAATHSTEAQTRYDLYFQFANLDTVQGGDAVGAEASSVDRAENRTPQETAQALMTALLSGPTRENLKNTIPVGTTLLGVTVEDGRAEVNLSSQYRMLSGISLTLADYCIALTLTQIPQVRSVSVTVRGQELAYRATQHFSGQDVLLSTAEDVVSTVDALLYFLDEGGKLNAESRTLELYEGDTQAQALIDALEEGPETKDWNSAFPTGFAVQSAWLERGVCYVNVASAAVDALPRGTNLNPAVTALTRSLLSLEAVEEVCILVDGELTDRCGNVDVSAPFTGE